MKRWLFGLAVLQSLSGLASSVELFRDQDGVTHFVEEVENTVPATKQAFKILTHKNNPASPDEVEGSLAKELDYTTVIVDKIVNLGKKVWTVIDNGRPVLNVETQYANALPSGVRASDLENFSDLQFRSFRRYGVNLFGATVYDLTYTLVHRFGGQYDGRGAYIESATVLPQHVEVLWGYDVNFTVERVGAVNLGTKENPVASIAMETGLTIKTVLQEVRFKNLYEFRGDSPAVRSTELE